MHVFVLKKILFVFFKFWSFGKRVWCDETLHRFVCIVTPNKGYQ